MADRLVVQASGAMFSTLAPPGWGFVFGLCVTDQDGVPVTGLKKANFAVFGLTTIGQLTLRDPTDLHAEFPAYNLPGVYRIQTDDVLPSGAPAPQEFVFALRVSKGRGIAPGITTVPITYLGMPH